ncbi:MAG: AAA family ATPase [Acidobacteriota bacterium]
MIRKQAENAATKEIIAIMDRLRATGEDALAMDEKMSLLRGTRDESSASGSLLDQFLLNEVEKLRAGLDRARSMQRNLETMLGRVTAPPWHSSTFMGRQQTERGPAAKVRHGGTQRIVLLSDAARAETFVSGEEVLLSESLNLVIGKSPFGCRQAGETAVYRRRLPDGRLVIRSRDEEMVVDTAGGMDVGHLKEGDLILWNRDLWLAFEKVERPSWDHLFLETTTQDTFDRIGGLDHQIDCLKRLIEFRLHHPRLAEKYGLRPKGSVLMAGPPGTGKTMLARAFANWLAQSSASGRSRFMHIKPGSLHSVWYSQAEANYREVFQTARQAARLEPEVPVVMFFDEIDALGAARSGSLARVDDRVLPAFMTELDGLEARGNVVVVGATNRADALDPALLRPGRLGDLVLEVPRPGWTAARAIFRKYLGAGVPLGSNGRPAPGREQLIDAVAARIYAPNGIGELATLTFRDGTRHAVMARELISGAMIAKMVTDAAEQAWLREVETGEAGLRLEDLMAAAEGELARAARFLTPGNCRKHLADLPQDVDVVRVEAVHRPAAPAGTLHTGL